MEIKKTNCGAMFRALGVHNYLVKYRYSDGMAGMCFVVATTCANAEHFFLDRKDGAEMARQVAYAEVTTEPKIGFITAEAAQIIALDAITH